MGISKTGLTQELEAVRDGLVAYCRQIVWDPQDLEDAVQETLLTALRKGATFQSGSNFRAWIYKIATHTVFNLNRRRARLYERESVFEEEDMEVEAADQVLSELSYDELIRNPDQVLEFVDTAIADGLKQLNANERSCLLLRVLGDLRYREIAEILELPVGSVMSCVHRARCKLRFALAEYGRSQPSTKEVEPR